jgi:hypothetical protein
MTVISKRGVIGTAAVVAGITATGAMAVPPPPSSIFTGQTSQKIQRHDIKVVTDANSHVSQVVIQWRAKCKVKGLFWTATTSVRNGPNGLPQTGDVFRTNGSYTGNAGGGIKGRITIALQGAFTDADHASGKWSASVVVRKRGKKIDSCKTPKKPITWSVSRTS